MGKYKLLLSFFLFPISLFSQQATFEETINSLKDKISIATPQEKLFLLDSLTLLIEFNTSYDFEATTIETIDHAFSLDSLEAAAFHIVQLLSLIHI